ncbi:MAG: lipopolysaccharide transport periplasmic protein LptA [Deltaproteobacteria bacterium]|nr:MAG: lipopolysaccharide transport periplasmic protein LptA [Deltaproteobacteria bacterium]
MRPFRCSPALHQLLAFLAAALILNGVNPATITCTENEKLTAGKPSQNGKIYITADKLVSDNDTQSAEFMGNVKATQGTTVITADRLKIYYSVPEKTDRPIAGEEAIQKIIASGKVSIRFGDILAKTKQAVYTKETRTIVLTGPNSTIEDGNNSIAGSTITLYMDGKSIRVSSGQRNRVNAVFHPGEK